MFSSKIYLQLIGERRVAVRDNRSRDHVADLNEEIAKYKHRVVVLNDFDLEIVEKRVITTSI